MHQVIMVTYLFIIQEIREKEKQIKIKENQDKI